MFTLAAGFLLKLALVGAVAWLGQQLIRLAYYTLRGVVDGFLKWWSDLRSRVGQSIAVGGKGLTFPPRSGQTFVETLKNSPNPEAKKLGCEIEGLLKRNAKVRPGVLLNEKDGAPSKAWLNL